MGLTGGIASGKTTVSDRFREIGADVVDTDEIARNIVQPGLPAFDEIVAHFGEGVLAADGSLDRAALRKRVFESPGERRILESYTHYRIRAEAWRQIAGSSAPYVVLVVPLLVESNFHTQVDRVLVVDCAPATQLARLIERDGDDPQTARAIISAQSDRDERLDKADDVIVNDGSLEELLSRVDALHEHYLQLAGQSARLSQNSDQ